MEIQIIGFGVVGAAQAYLLHRLGHEVYACDVEAKPAPSYVHFSRHLQANVDASFICTPESAVNEVMHSLRRVHVKGLYVIKSTTSPGTTERLMRRYAVHICHNPEFLREKHALEDIVNPALIVIGECCRDHGKVLRSLYEPLGRPLHVTGPTTSEMAKLAVNAYLSTLITFWNEVHELSSVLGFSTEKVAEIARGDPRVSPYGTAFFGRPFEGGCLPKDLAQMISTYDLHDINPVLLTAVQSANAKVKKTA